MTGRRRWACHSLAVTGASHRRQDQPGADAAATVSFRSGIVLMVADGAGSSPLGAEASRLAIESLRRAVSQSGDQRDRSGGHPQVVTSAEDVFYAGVADFLRRGVGVGEELKTTLAMVFVNPPWLVHVGIGDAFVVAADRKRQTHLIVTPRAVGSPRNETEFVTAKAKPRVGVFYDPGWRGVILSTDGLEPFLDEKTLRQGNSTVSVPWRPAEQVFNNLMTDLRNGSSPEALGVTLSGSAFQSRKGDDIGIAVAVR